MFDFIDSLQFTRDLLLLPPKKEGSAGRIAFVSKGDQKNDYCFNMFILRSQSGVGLRKAKYLYWTVQHLAACGISLVQHQNLGLAYYPGSETTELTFRIPFGTYDVGVLLESFQPHALKMKNILTI